MSIKTVIDQFVRALREAHDDEVTTTNFIQNDRTKVWVKFQVSPATEEEIEEHRKSFPRDTEEAKKGIPLS